MRKLIFWFLFLIVVCAAPAAAADAGWEYQVVILQGVTAGGTVEKQARGVYVDTRRTQILNELAVDGWEVISAFGAPGMDHAVYLRRESGRLSRP